MQLSWLTDQLRLWQLDRGIIRLSTDVDDCTVNDFLDELAYVQALPPTNIPSITLEILCPGGDAYASLAAYDALVASPKPVVGLVLGYAASAAAMVILQGCSTRLSYPNARFLIHEIQDLHFGIEKLSSAEDNAQELNKVQDSIIRIMAVRTGKSVEKLKAAIHRRENWMCAEEALAFGLIDKIVAVGGK